jgi:hypothetical protein
MSKRKTSKAPKCSFCKRTPCICDERADRLIGLLDTAKEYITKLKEKKPSSWCQKTPLTYRLEEMNHGQQNKSQRVDQLW